MEIKDDLLININPITIKHDEALEVELDFIIIVVVNFLNSL